MRRFVYHVYRKFTSLLNGVFWGLAFDTCLGHCETRPRLRVINNDRKFNIDGYLPVVMSDILHGAI